LALFIIRQVFNPEPYLNEQPFLNPKLINFRLQLPPFDFDDHPKEFEAALLTQLNPLYVEKDDVIYLGEAM
jgi:hypothetical protein